MSPSKFGKLVNDNIVVLLGIPLVFGIHWGWWKLQKNPALVSPEDRRELPLYTVYQDLKSKLLRSMVSEPVGGSPENGS